MGNRTRESACLPCIQPWLPCPALSKPVCLNLDCWVVKMRGSEFRGHPLLHKFKSSLGLGNLPQKQPQKVLEGPLTDPTMPIHLQLELLPPGREVSWGSLLWFWSLYHGSGASQKRMVGRMSLSVTQHKLKHIFFASILSQCGLTHQGQVARLAY